MYVYIHYSSRTGSQLCEKHVILFFFCTLFPVLDILFIISWFQLLHCYVIYDILYVFSWLLYDLKSF